MTSHRITEGTRIIEIIRAHPTIGPLPVDYIISTHVQNDMGNPDRIINIFNDSRRISTLYTAKRYCRLFVNVRQRMLFNSDVIFIGNYVIHEIVLYILSSSKLLSVMRCVLRDIKSFVTASIQIVKTITWDVCWVVSWPVTSAGWSVVTLVSLILTVYT